MGILLVRTKAALSYARSFILRKSEYAGDLHRELARTGYLGICMCVTSFKFTFASGISSHQGLKNMAAPNSEYQKLQSCSKPYPNRGLESQGRSPFMQSKFIYELNQILLSYSMNPSAFTQPFLYLPSPRQSRKIAISHKSSQERKGHALVSPNQILDSTRSS